ncbi:MAG: hypothetical protein KM310_02895 [Clostridiales bacterium]|nr:hypothetical protein [Clostridiales bacterium]
MGRRRFWIWGSIGLLALLFFFLLAASGAFSRSTVAMPVEAAREVQAGHLPDEIQLVAVQYRFSAEEYVIPGKFRQHVDAIMKKVKARLDPRVPALVVFPEDIGTFLVLQGAGRKVLEAPGLGAAVETFVKDNLVYIFPRKARLGVSYPRAIFLWKGPEMAREYFSVFSDMAKTYGVYIQAGSIVLPDTQIRDGQVYVAQKGKEIYNVAFLFGPDGKVLGQQKKVHLIELEGPAGLDIVPAPLDQIHVIDTPLGKVGIAICLDAFEEDVLDRLVDEGARILLQPSANPGEWSEWQRKDWLRGSYKAVMEDGRFPYAVNPMMTGNIFDLGFYGQSSVVSAATETPLRNYKGLPPTDGFAAVAETDGSEEILVVKVPHPAKLTMRSE